MSRCRPSQVNGESHRRPDGPRLSPCSSGLSKAARLAAHYRLSPCTYAMSFATATICIAVPCHASFACPASVHSPRTPSARRARGTSTNSIPGNRNGRGGALAWVQCHAIFAFSFGRRKVWLECFFSSLFESGLACPNAGTSGRRCSLRGCAAAAAGAADLRAAILG